MFAESESYQKGSKLEGNILQTKNQKECVHPKDRERGMDPEKSLSNRYTESAFPIRLA